MSSPVSRRAFNFQISKPIMTGYMQKQGAIHKAFKRRFFVLYPGFLVYYDREDKWQSDVHRETLGGRLNAIKLKGGRLDKAKHAPKGCNYGISVTSPDPHNKRSEYLFNCQSNEERFQWMQHIQSAIPSSSSNLKVKNTAAETPVTADKPAATEKSKEAPQAKEKPVNPIRQETVDEAAMMAVGGLEDVEDELTDMDEVLGPKNDDAQSSSSDGSSPPSSLSPEEEVTHYVVSSASVQANSGPSTPADSPVPVNKNTHKEVKENGHDTTVAEEREEEAHSKQEETEEKANSKAEKEEEAHSKEQEVVPSKEEEEVVPSKEEGEVVPTKEEGEVVHSKEVTVPASQSPELVIKVSPEPGSSNKKFSSSDDDSEGEELPPAPSDTTSTSTEGDRQPDSANSEPASPTTNGHENGLRTSPDLDARRPSGIKSFIEKRGFLYKMGGNFKTWKLRYFVLQPGMFSYYKKDPKEKPLGEVKLKNLQIMFPKPNERTYSSYQFVVHTESQWNRRNDYVMAAKSEKEMKEWIDAFKLASGLKRLSSEAASHRDAATVASSAVKH